MALCPCPMKHSDAEYSELDDVRQLPNAGMHQVQCARACEWKEPPQHGKNDTPGLLAAETVRGKKRNQYPNHDGR